MSRVKEWGFEIAQMLFEQKMTVDQVVDIIMSKSEEIDRNWLKEQVQYVKSNRKNWGYSYRHELPAQRKRDGKYYSKKW